MNLIETGHHQVNADCDPYLGSHRVLAGAEECFDAEVLLDPLEEQFDLPAPFVDGRDDLRGQIEVIGQKDQTLTGLGIEEANTPEFPRVVPLAFVSAQSDGLVAAQTAGLVDRAGLAEVESRVAFRPDDKVGVGAFDSKQPGKVEVSPVKDIDTPGLNEHPVHEVDVMHRTVCDLYKDGDRTGQVDLGMKFYRGFGLAEMRPREHRQAQVNGGSIDGINHLVDVESVGVFHIKSPCPANQNLRERFVNTPVSMLVCVSQISPSDIAPDAHAVEMRTASQTCFDISKTLPESYLRKSHRKELVSGSHTLTRPRHRVKRHAAIELLTVDEIRDLSENETSSVHPLLRMHQTSSRQLSQMRHMPFSLLAA